MPCCGLDILVRLVAWLLLMSSLGISVPPEDCPGPWLVQEHCLLAVVPNYVHMCSISNVCVSHLYRYEGQFYIRKVSLMNVCLLQYPANYVNQVQYTNVSMRVGPGRTYRFYSGTPVYPFGYGLSYTEFKFEWYISMAITYMGMNSLLF